ncbi:CU044_2847 family protein [Micromonospora costi]|uniref:CU044_2847 family protein n=1 Tax=Micromonospora costi TaxID=1530042 RepID=UPI00131A3A18|nr:CU044_2847 family protein [Micromonospora costi]
MAGSRSDTVVPMVSAILPSGREILIPATADGATQGPLSGPEGDFSDVAFHLEFKDLVDTATEIAQLLRRSMEKILPQKATVELSIGVDAKSGQLTAFFVEGSANGALKLTLEWGGQSQESA